MTCQQINFKETVAGILLATVLFLNTQAQEAENIYHKQFSKLSLVIQPSWIVANNYNNSDGTSYPSMKFTNKFSYQFGVHYNFAQSGNFNFQTGLIAKEFSPSFDLNISDDDIGYGRTFDLTDYNPFNQFIICIPFKTEYFLKLNPKLNIVFGAGLNLNLFTGDNVNTNVSVAVSDGINSKDIFSAQTTTQEKRTFTTEISIGFNYKTKFALLQLDLFSSGDISSHLPVEGNYQIYNLENSPDKNGRFLISGKYHGLSLSIVPNKGWLKKKKN